MDTVPKRSIIATPYRYILEHSEKYLIFPIQNPDFYTILSGLLSIPFLFISDKLTLIILIILVLFFDWCDGAVARRNKLKRKTGYMTDVVFDRISEGLMFAPLLGTSMGKMLFFLFLLNNILSFYAISSNKHYLLPLRFIYLVLLVV